MNAVIFDFDGTLADSFEQVFDFLLKQTGRQASEFSPEQMKTLHGLSMRDLALKMGVPAWKLPWVYMRGKAALTNHMHSTPVFPGVNDMLAALYAEDYQLYIISSNSKRNIQRFLTQHGLGGYFRHIYGNTGWFGKASALRRAIQQNGLEPGKVVYVGDEVRDVIGARLSGMPSAAVNWGFGSEPALLEYSPTVLVRSVKELQKELIDWGPL